jgi:hypothetical protein
VLERRRLVGFLTGVALVVGGSFVLVGTDSDAGNATDAANDRQARRAAVAAIFGDPINETTKAQIEAEDAALKAIGEAFPSERSMDPPPAVDMSDEYWGHGLSSDGGGEFPRHSGFSFTAPTWQGESNGSHVRVYAGALTLKPETGVVLVMFIDPKTWGHTFEQLHRPGSGSLTLVAADGDSLTMLAASGGSLTFDVDSLTLEPA